MQHRSEAREAFLRYRDQGDSTALAEVFDLVAQHLLLVASHLAGKQQQPEDLLQETFLTAIQKADRYDGARPLEPWLIGILVNVTRSDWRRRSREQSGADVGESPVAEFQPFHKAVEGEFLDALRAAIDGLPVPQREVMTLNLVHGMTPTEIAHATSRPVGTVKSWIHRSLEAVRRRLPVSMAGAFAAFSRGMDGLERVRESVVEAAAEASIATATGSGGAAEVVTRTVARGWLRWALVGVVLVAAPLVWMELVAEQSPVLEAGQNDQVVDGGGQTDVVDSPTQPTVDRDPVATTPSAETADLVITGDFDGEPFAWGGYLLIPTLPDTQLQPVTFRTGDEGSYTYRGVPYGSYQLQPDRGEQVTVDVDRPKVSVQVSMREPEQRGRVVDERGSGVAGATIWQTIAGTLEQRLQVAVCDDNGEFVVRSATTGRYLSAASPGRLPSYLRQIRGGDEREPIELVLDRVARRLQIKVVDEADQPMAGVRLQIGDAMAAPPRSENEKSRVLRQPWHGRSDESGTAVCTAVAPDASLPLFARAVGYAPFMRFVRATDGEETIRIKLSRGAECAGRLQDADGAAVLGATRAIVIGALGNQLAPGWFWPTCLTNDDGTYTLWGMPVGDVLLQARTTEGVMVEAERTTSVDRKIEWSPVFGTGGAVSGRVLDADGAPLRGWSVRLLATGRIPVATELDDDGRFSFEQLPDRTFELQIVPGNYGDAMVLLRRYGVRIGAELDLMLPRDATPGAIVRGQLTTSKLRQVGLFQARSGRYVSADVGENGHFEFREVPPGEYHLMGGNVRILFRHDITLAAGAVQDLGVVDTTPRTEVTIESAGTSAEHPGVLYVFPPQCGPMIGFGMIRGRHTISLPQGTCRLLMQRDGVYLAHRVIEVGDAPLSVELPTAKPNVVRLTARPASPSAELSVYWHIDGPTGPMLLTTRRPRADTADKGAGLSVALPDGDYTARATTADGASATMTFTLPRDPSERLPEVVMRHQ